MGVFEMVVAIVAIAFIGGIIREVIKKKHTTGSEDVKNLHERIDKLEALEERVQALETIVTDRKEDLKREIDNL